MAPSLPSWDEPRNRVQIARDPDQEVGETAAVAVPEQMKPASPCWVSQAACTLNA
jgi:hypothetical protein